MSVLKSLNFTPVFCTSMTSHWQAAKKENELLRKKREEFENAVLSFDSKSKFITELRQRQKEQLEFRGQQLQEKIATTIVRDR